MQKQDISRLDLLNYISHGISKIPLEEEKEHDFEIVEDEDSPHTNHQQNPLDLYTQNLSKLAEEQKIDPQLADELLSMAAGIEGTSGMKKPE